MAIDISHYNSGTATVAAGGTTVTGQGTTWEGSVRPGDLFGTHVGDGIRIESVNSNTSLTLAYPWVGDAQTAAPYEIQRTPYDIGYQRAVEELLLALQEGNLPAFSALVGAANTLPYFDSADSMALTGLTAWARTLLDDTNAAAARGTLGATTVGGNLFTATNAAAARGVISALTTGDFGLGSSNLPEEADLNNIAAGTTFFRWGSNTNATNRPSNFGAGIQIERSSGAIIQLGMSSSGQMYSRAFTRGTPVNWTTGWDDATAPVVSQAEATAGTSTSARMWTPQRVAQAIGALIPSDVYRRSNILANVSQSGGVPTGGIIERGANSTGEYVRYADGTQICTYMRDFTPNAVSTASGSWFVSGGWAWAYPSSFAAAPACNGSTNRNLAGSVSFSSTTTTSTNYLFGFSETLGAGLSKQVYLTAIGRWF